MSTEIAHFLKLRRSTIGKVPSTAGGKIFDDFGFTETMRAPDANRRAATPDSGDLVVSLENVG
jgi:hypothetical protein